MVAEIRVSKNNTNNSSGLDSWIKMFVGETKKQYLYEENTVRKSFNNVDKTLQQNNLLQRPGQVIETPEVKASSENYGKNTSQKRIFNNAIGF